MKSVKIEPLVLVAQHAVRSKILDRDPEIAIEFVVSAMSREVIDLIVFRCECPVASSKRERVEKTDRVPADWWQAFRERWFPRWALARWPVRMREIACWRTVYHVCPHVAVPGGDARHAFWLSFEPPTWRRAP